MIQNILKSIHTKFGRYLVSVILGIGLASIFRKSCDNKDCLDFKGPHHLDIIQKIYKHNNECYSFEQASISCDKKKSHIEYE